MITLSTSIVIEFVLGLFLWWLAIYLFTQNPINRLSQVSAGILASISFYFSSDLFLFVVRETHQYSLNTTILRSFNWALYLPIALLYHVSFLLIPTVKRRLWQKVGVYAAYLFSVGLFILEGTTNLIRHYDLFSSPDFHGNIDQATGQYFWLAGLFLILSISFTAANFYSLARQEKKFSPNWYKFFYPFAGLTLSVLLGPFVLLSYYNIIPHPVILPVIDLALVVFPLMYAIIRHNLFINDAKVIFGKNFLYSTLSVVSILLIYFTIVSITSAPFRTIHDLILPFALAYLLVASHPFYNWLSTFVNDLVYNPMSGFSIVTDEEIAQALKNFNSPERLESSSLLRLRSVSKVGDSNSIDRLQILIEEAIEYFKPKADATRRTKRNLKYHLLKMIAFDEAEEGQILWELGFEEYPVKIMSQERSYRKPLFSIQSPSDYTYISRNAFMALKKEAIHDVTWRISYLEKQAKRKLF